MKQMLIPKRGDLIVLYVGLSLLLCVTFPVSLLVDYLQFAILQTVQTVWVPLHVTGLLAAFGCLLAWTAFSQTQWWKRIIILLALVGAGLGLMWLSAFLIRIIEAPRAFHTEPVLEIVLVGIVGLPWLVAIKYFLGIQLLHGQQKPKPPRIILLLISMGVVLIPALIISRLAQEYRDVTLQHVAELILASAFFASISIGIPAWILSRKWKQWVRGLVFALFLLPICAIPIGLGIARELDQYLWLAGFFWGGVFAAAALLVMVLSAIFVAAANGYRFVAAQRIAGKWLTETEAESVKPQTDRVKCSLVSWVLVALMLGGIFYFEKSHDVPTFVFSQFGQKFRNARFAKNISRLREADFDGGASFLYEDDDFELDLSLGTIVRIDIHLDEEAADELIAELGSLAEIPTVEFHGVFPCENDPSTWNTTSMTSTQLDALSRCPNVKSVRFALLRFDDSVTTDLRNLESVELLTTENTDAFLTKLAETNSLKSLLVGNTDLSEIGFEKIKTMTSLQELMLDQNHLESKSLRGISRLENLEVLRLENVAVDDLTVDQEITQLRNLSVLNLSGSDVSFQGLQRLNALPKLKTLEINVTKLSVRDYIKLKATAAFQIDNYYDEYCVDWLNQSISDNGGDLFAALEGTASKIQRDADGNIVELEFDQVRISVHSIKKLLVLTQLQSLDLEESELSATTWPLSESLVQIQSFPKLERLRMPSVMIDDSLFVGLTEIPTLTEISFDPALVSDDLYPKLTDLPELKQVRLLSGRVEASLIKQLQSMSLLEEIVIVAPAEAGMAKTYAEQAEKDLKSALDGKTIRIETRRKAEK